jgi:hypothetical protein
MKQRNNQIIPDPRSPVSRKVPQTEGFEGLHPFAVSNRMVVASKTYAKQFFLFYGARNFGAALLTLTACPPALATDFANIHSIRLVSAELRYRFRS